MAFNGKLVELKTGNNYVELPLKYVKAESYTVTPEQRMEISANRASTGLLKRNTLSHTASKIDLETVPVTNSDVAILNTLFSNAFTDAQERKLDLRYYNPATDSYNTGTFYMPDTEYHILNINGTTIQYDSVRFAFIEY